MVPWCLVSPCFNVYLMYVVGSFAQPSYSPTTQNYILQLWGFIWLFVDIFDTRIIIVLRSIKLLDVTQNKIYFTRQPLSAALDPSDRIQGTRGGWSRHRKRFSLKPTLGDFPGTKIRLGACPELHAIARNGDLCVESRTARRVGVFRE